MVNAKSTQKGDNMNNALLSQKIDDSGISKRHIAKQLGISVEALRRRRNGTVSWTSSDIPIICKVLNLTTDDARDIFLS